jgi:hypothetical protein
MEFVWMHASHATENFAPHNLAELSTKIHSGIAKVRGSKDRLSACFTATHLSCI